VEISMPGGIQFRGYEDHERCAADVRSTGEIPELGGVIKGLSRNRLQAATTWAARRAARIVDAAFSLKNEQK
jgi:hypothetical protein